MNTRNQKYAVLSDIRVSHDYRTDTVQLTSGDSDLSRDGFLINIKSGTRTDTALRRKLVSEGLYRHPLINVSPAVDIAKIVLSNAGQGTITHVFGRVGSGKSTFARSVLEQANSNGRKAHAFFSDDYQISARVDKERNISASEQEAFHFERWLDDVESQLSDSNSILILDYGRWGNDGPNRWSVGGELYFKAMRIFELAASQGWTVITTSNRARTFEGKERYRVAFGHAAGDQNEADCISSAFDIDPTILGEYIKYMPRFDYLTDALGVVTVGRTPLID